MRKGILAGSLALAMFGWGSLARPQQSIPDAPKPQTTLQETLAQQSIPDAPKAQAPISIGTVTPGQGSSSTAETDSTQGDSGTPATTPAATSSTPPAAGNQPPAFEPPAGEAAEAVKTYRVHVDYVDLPFTVKDGKKQVYGLHARDIQVYENGALQNIRFFTDDGKPLSVALVIDQTMTPDNMTRVNDALGALQDAFTKYDEVTVFTYNKSPKLITDFTGAQSPRLTQAIERSKGSGRELPMAGSYSGPMSCTTCVNNQNFDPNTAAVRGNTNIQLSPEREVHPLNDAILAAATALSRRPLDFRRVIYVISDGHEYGSKAKTSEVIQYLERNQIEVDGTLVGDSSLPILGTLDQLHLPLMMRDNVLVAYQKATGGQLDSEFTISSIEKSFAAIAAEARNRYYVGYYSSEPFIDGKYRKVEVVVLNHGNNLTVLAKKGYYPEAMEVRPQSAPAPAR